MRAQRIHLRDLVARPATPGGAGRARRSRPAADPPLADRRTPDAAIEAASVPSAADRTAAVGIRDSSPERVAAARAVLSDLAEWLLSVGEPPGP